MYTPAEKEILQAAEEIVTRYAVGRTFEGAKDTQEVFTYRLAGKEREVFEVAFLDTKHRLLKIDRMFLGTIDRGSVHPREVVKAALEYNAAAAILAHNHPSGESTPSTADKRLTERLVEALSIVDVHTLDHIVVGKGECTSFAENGLL